MSRTGSIAERGISVVCVAFSLVLFFNLGCIEARAYDEKLFCDAGGNDVVVFVDVTTDFDEQSKSEFLNGIQTIYSSLLGGQRLTISTIEDSFTASTRMYEGCVPYCPEMGILESLGSDCTPGLIRLQRNTQKQAIGAALRNRFSTAHELQRSEIIRTLTMTLKSTLRKGHKSEIYIFSDMIENSEFMPGKTFWWAPWALNIEFVQQNGLMPNLKGAKVEVFGVGRGGDPRRTVLSQKKLNILDKFWNGFFELAGATDIRIGESLAAR